MTFHVAFDPQIREKNFGTPPTNYIQATYSYFSLYKISNIFIWIKHR